MTIRRAVHADVTAMVRVRREAILAKAASHYDQATLNDWARPADDADRAARFGQKISDSSFIVLAAEAFGDIIGFAIAVPSNNELQALYVKPNLVGHVGRALLAAVENLAFETAPYLVCDAALNAARFYEANGYIAECRKDHVTIPGGVISRVVQMRKHRSDASMRAEQRGRE
jgi:putative acetyltransferase